MTFSGSGLNCYKCESYSGLCETVESCTFEDACISLSDASQFFIPVLMQLVCPQYCPNYLVEVVGSELNKFKLNVLIGAKDFSGQHFVVIIT